MRADHTTWITRIHTTWITRIHTTWITRIHTTWTEALEEPVAERDGDYEDDP